MFCCFSFFVIDVILRCNTSVNLKEKKTTKKRVFIGYTKYRTNRKRIADCGDDAQVVSHQVVLASKTRIKVDSNKRHLEEKAIYEVSNICPSQILFLHNQIEDAKEVAKTFFKTAKRNSEKKTSQ